MSAAPLGSGAAGYEELGGNFLKNENSNKGKMAQVKTAGKTGKKLYVLAMALKPSAALFSIFAVILSVFLPYLGVPFVLEFFHIEALSNWHIFIMDVSIVTVIVFFAVPFFSCIMAVKYDKHELTSRLQELTEQLEGSLKYCGNLATHIEKCPRRDNQTIVVKSNLMGFNDFFTHLYKARNQASENTEIRLMNFARSINTQKETDIVKQYYEEELIFYSENADKVLYRIVSIHTKDKFKDCIKWAKEASEKELSNYNLAYLGIDEFGEKLPKITGVQIIDNDEVILMDPTVARLSNTNFHRPIFIKSSEIARKYKDYYTGLWKEIRDYHEQWLKNGHNSINKEGYIGHILYTEEDGLAKNNVWIELNKKMPDNQRLNDAELAEIGIANLPGNCSTQEKLTKTNTVSSFLKRLFGKNNVTREHRR